MTICTFAYLAAGVVRRVLTEQWASSIGDGRVVVRVPGVLAPLLQEVGVAVRFAHDALESMRRDLHPLILELIFRPVMQFNIPNVLSTLYVAIFPSTIAYICFNRGIQFETYN